MFDLFAGTGSFFFICFVIFDELDAFYFLKEAASIDGVELDMAPFRDLSFMLELVVSAAADKIAAEFLLLVL